MYPISYIIVGINYYYCYIGMKKIVKRITLNKVLLFILMGTSGRGLRKTYFFVDS